MATVSLAACAGHPVGDAAGRPSSPAANTTPAVSPPAIQAATPSSAAPSATPNGTGGVENLVITSAEKSELTAAFVAALGIPASDVVGPYPGDTYYAYDTTTDTYWAMAVFGWPEPPPPGVLAAFQNGQEGLYKKVGAGPWQVTVTGVATFCGPLQFFPPSVLIAWADPTTPPAGQTC